MDKSHHLRISLSLWGNSLDPQEITRILKLEPSTHWKKGDVKKLSSGKQSAPRELGIWVFDNKNISSIEECITEFLQKTGDRNLKEIEGVELAIMDIYLGLSDERNLLERSYEFRVDNASLNRLAALGVDVRVTVS